YMATVTTSVQFVRSLGQVFGVAIVGTVFNNKLTETLMANFPKDPRIEVVAKNTEMGLSLFDAPQQLVIFESFVDALRYVFYCSVAFCSLAFIMSTFIQHKVLKTNANQAKPELTPEMV
ncbi:hypothetical protein BGZ95_003324, partial [Linnemannia exigua]